MTEEEKLKNTLKRDFDRVLRDMDELVEKWEKDKVHAGVAINAALPMMLNLMVQTAPSRKHLILMLSLCLEDAVRNFDNTSEEK